MKKLLLILLLVPSIASASCRSPAVKHKFDVLNGYPHGRPGYIVDHVCSLFNGGIDNVRNMQYQTLKASAAKDRIENTAVGRDKFCTPLNSTPTRLVFNCTGGGL